MMIRHAHPYYAIYRQLPSPLPREKVDKFCVSKIDQLFYLESVLYPIPRWGRGGGRRGGGGGVISYIYGILRMCVPNSPLFQRCQVYDWPPFFNQKYMNGPIFLDSYVKGPIFLTSWYMHIFFAQRFFEAAYPLGIT